MESPTPFVFEVESKGFLTRCGKRSACDFRPCENWKNGSVVHQSYELLFLVLLVIHVLVICGLDCEEEESRRPSKRNWPYGN